MHVLTDWLDRQGFHWHGANTVRAPFRRGLSLDDEFAAILEPRQDDVSQEQQPDLFRPESVELRPQDRSVAEIRP